jgi:hypothetical protein
MANNISNANPSEPDDSGAQPSGEPLPKSRKALSRLQRELSHEDLATPGVQKMLIEELERAEDELSDAKFFRDKFHLADKDLAVTKEKLKGWTAMEIISTASIAVGAAAFAYAPEAAKTPYGGWVVAAGAFILTIIGVIAKAIRIK